MRRRRRRERMADDQARARVAEDFDRFIGSVHDYFGEWTGHRGYTRHVGQPGPGPNPHRLGRNVRAGKIAGVCAGVADYFGWRVKWVRLSAIVLTGVSFPVPIIIYIAAAVLMPRGGTNSSRYSDPEEERFWRTYSVKPKMTYAELKHRFRAIDARIADMERAVTSDEYTLRKQFRDLERGA